MKMALSGRHNEGTQVAIKGELLAGFIHALDFFFRKLQPEYTDQTPQWDSTHPRFKIVLMLLRACAPPLCVTPACAAI